MLRKRTVAIFTGAMLAVALGCSGGNPDRKGGDGMRREGRGRHAIHDAGRGDGSLKR